MTWGRRASFSGVGILKRNNVRVVNNKLYFISFFHFHFHFVPHLFRVRV